ncbi:hypothetical protein HDU84_001688 [Entophlyctis sp. JEL0112]|nr:hypothetical protein HDU84_001688 [Entophlyctis sp. JEL0112]
MLRKQSNSPVLWCASGNGRRVKKKLPPIAPGPHVFASARHIRALPEAGIRLPRSQLIIPHQASLRATLSSLRAFVALQSSPSTYLRAKVAVAAAILTFYIYFVRSGPVFSFWYKFLGLFPPPPSKSRVEGFVKPEYAALKDILRKGFEHGDDLGSQVTVYVDGELVADLAGGYTDTTYTKPYDTNTLQQVFSCSKFVTSMVFLHLVNTKRIRLSDPIVKYWPEFGLGGKSHVTIGHLLSHQGGVSYLDKHRVPTPEDMLDLDILAAKIADQPHNFGGSHVSSYHAVTRGWFLNEIARRATGKTVRQLMYEEILPIMNHGRNDAFGVRAPRDDEGSVPYEFHYGIPDSLSALLKDRIAPLDSSNFFYRVVCCAVPTWIMHMCGLCPVDQSLVSAFLFRSSTENKALMSSGEKEFPWSFNDPVCRSSESPSFNGFTNTRFLARLAELVRRSAPNATTGPHSDTDPGLVRAETFSECFSIASESVDAVIRRRVAFTNIGTGLFSTGFGFDTPWVVAKGVPFYGWAGAGGSLVVFNIEYGIAFAYAMNFAHLQALGDHRSWRLIGEVFRVVKEKKGDLTGKSTA